MSEKIRILLESLTLEEIEELKNLASKKEKKLKPTFSFSKITDENLNFLFDVFRNDETENRFDFWFSEAQKIEISQKTVSFLADLIKKEKNNIKDYLEEDLKIKFISKILEKVEFQIKSKQIRDFYEQKISYSNSKGSLNGTVDFVIAKGRKTAQKPYFFIQEFKKSIEGFDPEPQLVAELISAVEINNWQEIKGAFIIGSLWYFVILEKIGKDKYQYFVSDEKVATKIDDLELIFKTLLFVKQEIINLEKSN